MHLYCIAYLHLQEPAKDYDYNIKNVLFQDEYEERQDPVYCGLWSGQGVY